MSRSARAGAGGGASLLAALLLALPAGATAATPPTMTETFASKGTQQEFTVPVGVSGVRVEAIGAAGGDGLGFGGGVGGAGADVVGELPVTAGEVLYVEVAAAGFNGGADGGPGSFDTGGSGGGASDVRTIPMGSLGSPESRLLVAAGGGGGGGALDGAGGVGGNAGNPGTNGSSEVFSTGGAAGGAGTLTGGGAGGSSCPFTSRWKGGDGALGLGGQGGESLTGGGTGGGGGGGYTGGGGGEGICDFAPQEGSGGGGGGASFVFGGATFSSFGAASISTAPSVSISYPSPATATPNTNAITFPATQPLQTISPPQTVTITNEGGNPLQIGGTTFAGSTPAVATDHPEDFLIGSSGCIGEVAFEQTCQLTVRFAPQEPGTSTATLQIAGNMGAGPTTIALSGTGGSLPKGEPGASSAGGNGARGPAGPRGERGPAGYPAVYECHPRQGDGKFKTACFIRIMSSSSQSVMRATLRRGGTLYASGPAAGSQRGKDLLMRAIRPVPAGRYRLELLSRHGLTSRYVTVK